MNQLRALAWKEWHESRAYLFIGLGIFLGLPLIGGIEEIPHTVRRFEIDATTWVLAFGGVLAVIVAVAGTCRDVNSRLEDFWRSRPVSVARWFLVKYLVGLFTVLASCMVPIAVELFFNRDKQPLQVLVWFPFLWAAIFSIGFLAGCIARKTAHAATLALAGLLLIYMMPVILPPLEWLNTSRITEPDWPYVPTVQLFGLREILFALGMSAVAIVGLSTALVAIYRNWHVESGRKTMYGLVASALLLLFASAAFQLGTNLPVLQTITLPQDERIEFIRFNGTSGSVLSFTSRTGDNAHFKGGGHSSWDQHLRTFGLTDAGINLSAPIEFSPAPGQEENEDNNRWQSLISYAACSLSPQVSGRVNQVFAPDTKDIDNETPRTMELDLFDALTGAPIQNIRLWEAKNGHELYIQLHAWNHQLYVIGKRVMVFDISNPRMPRLVSDVQRDIETDIANYRNNLPASKAMPETKLLVSLPIIEGLPGGERVKIAAQAYGEHHFDGTTLCEETNTGPKSYRLASLNDDFAIFEQTGEFKPSFLERSFGYYGIQDHDYLQNGLLYHSDSTRSGVLNSAISIFNARGPHAMQRIGHFAAPQAYMVQPLPDGRALAGGGNKLYLIGPPPRQ